MLAKLWVLEQEDYDRWYETGKVPAIVKASAANKAVAADGQPVSAADKGKELATSKGCIACHSMDGSPKVGPSWKGLYGRESEMQDGQKIKADENYIRESIVEPNAKVVKGFAPAMPAFKGLLSDDEINSLIAYIKSLK